MADRHGAGVFPQKSVIPGSFPRHYARIEKPKSSTLHPDNPPRIFDTTPGYSSSTDQVVRTDKYVQAGGLLILWSQKAE